jgi:hypothetical protein
VSYVHVLKAEHLPPDCCESCVEDSLLPSGASDERDQSPSLLVHLTGDLNPRACQQDCTPYDL